MSHHLTSSLSPSLQALVHTSHHDILILCLIFAIKHTCNIILNILVIQLFCWISSFDYDSPYIVTLGRGRIIAGMDRGLVDMCLWERRRITIPPHLAYGKRGVGSIIPPDATLVFYVRMIKIERVRGEEGGEGEGGKEGKGRDRYCKTYM